jgi:hypothetical protein
LGFPTDVSTTRISGPLDLELDFVFSCVFADITRVTKWCFKTYFLLQV